MRFFDLKFFSSHRIASSVPIRIYPRTINFFLSRNFADLFEEKQNHWWGTGLDWSMIGDIELNNIDKGEFYLLRATIVTISISESRAHDSQVLSRLRFGVFEKHIFKTIFEYLESYSNYLFA